MRDKSISEIVADSHARMDRERRRPARLTALGIDNQSRYATDDLLDIIDHQRATIAALTGEDED